jgi:hypothetical protein
MGHSSNISFDRLGESSMATMVRCDCGSEYKRTETKLLLPHTGGAVCEICGAALEAWWESTHVPSFELVKRPDSPPRHRQRH